MTAFRNRSGSLAALPVTAILTSWVAFSATGCSPEPVPASLDPKHLGGSARSWNLVVISVDTLRADRLGAYGYAARPTSPRIDGWLAKSVTFDRALSPRAATWPALASLLTGLYPSEHGVLGNGQSFPDGVETLPLVLGAAGYRTAAFLGNMCNADHRGWDEFTCEIAKDGKLVNRTIDWIDGLQETADKRPFALWLHLFGPHSPYLGKRALRNLDPAYRGPLRELTTKSLGRLSAEGTALAEADVRHLDAIYDAAVRDSDQHFGRILDALEATGQIGRTVVVFVADHGEELYDHNHYFFHACSVYQTTLHVPLAIFAGELLPAGRRVPQLVELVDILPTLVDLLGVDAPSTTSGRSLRRYFGDHPDDEASKPAFSEYGATRIRTVFDGRFKLIDNPELHQPICIPDAPPGHYPIPGQQLFDIAADPGELVDLAAHRPEEVERLRGLIRRWEATLQRRDAPPVVDPRLREQLRSLGYVTP